MINDVALPRPMPEREPKEMLSIGTLPDGRADIRINYSSYTLISLCKRKAHYALNRGLVSNYESEATLFGRAIHAALEVWYTSPRSARKRGSAQCDDYIASLEAGIAVPSHGQCLRCASQARFLEVAQALSALDSSQKRSVRNGLTILDAYFDTYLDDPFVVLSDALGPICERRVSMILADESDSRVTFFGTLDTVLINEHNQHIVLCDHKTTSGLGTDFLQRIRPNWQYTNYLAAFRRTWPQHDTRTFMSNGLLVAKTKTAFLRQFTEIDDGLIEEARISLLDSAYDWWARVKSDGPWTMNAPDPCTQWGGCQYRTICEVPGHLRESIIASHYGERT